MPPTTHQTQANRQERCSNSNGNAICHICQTSPCICDVKVCNCARCRRLLTRHPPAKTLIRRQANGVLIRTYIMELAGYVDGRPYCSYCIPKEAHPAECDIRAFACRPYWHQIKMRELQLC